MSEPTPWRRARPELLAALLCAAVGMLLAIAPHLAMLWRHGTPDYLADYDEMLYLSIARAGYYGEGALRDPYSVPSRRVPSLYAWTQFVPLAVVASALGWPLVSLGMIWRIVGGLAMGASLYALFRRVMASTSRPVAWAVGCTLVCLADRGWIGGRTIVGDLDLVRHMLEGTVAMTKPDALAQYRVVTPLVNLPAFLGLLAVACAPTHRRGRGIVLGSVLLALCVYLYFFYWTVAVAALGLFAVANLVLARFGPAEQRPARREAGTFAAMILASGLALGAPSIYQTARSGADPALKPTLERISKGYHLHPGSQARTRNVRNVWIWAKLALGAFGIVSLGTRRAGLLWCATAVGYALANSALVTNLEFENFHWTYVHASSSQELTLAVVGQWLDRAATATGRRRLLGWLWLVPGGLGVIALAWRPYEALRAPEPILINRTLAELRPLRADLARLGPDCILAGAIPEIDIADLLSRCSLLYHPVQFQVVCLLPDREVHERAALDAWLRGLDLESYRRTLEAMKRFGYAEADDPRWPVPEIRRLRLELFQGLLDGDRTLVRRYPATHLLRATADGSPPRGGPWTRQAGNRDWTLWRRIANDAGQGCEAEAGSLPGKIDRARLPEPSGWRYPVAARPPEELVVASAEARTRGR
jgi:hypothetical protein